MLWSICSVKNLLMRVRKIPFKRILGTEHYDAEVKRYIENQNLQLGAPLSILTLIASAVMLIRQAMVKYSPMELSFYVIFFLGSVLMAMTFLFSRNRSRVQPFKNTTLIVYVYLASFLICQAHISVAEYLQGRGALAFTTMVVLGFMLFNLRPVAVMSVSAFTFLVIGIKITRYGYTTSKPQEYMVAWIVISFVTMVRYFYTMEAATHAVNNRRTAEKLQSISRTDALTGLNNRYALREDFEHMIGQRLEVMICDIDNFKKVNDTYGHDMGDEVLKRFGALAQTHFKDTVVYRYGGDEFMLISKQKETDFHREVRNFMLRFHHMTFEEGPKEPSCSCGYVFGYAESAEDLRSMFSQADEQLYQAKQTGKYNMKCHAYDFTLKDTNGKGQRLF